VDRRPVKVTYFSDLLCIWAYAAEARLQQLVDSFTKQIDIEYRFCPVFGDTATKIGIGWADRGGYEGFNRHVREVAEAFEHLSIHPRIWLDCRPRTSMSGHLWVKAAQLAAAVSRADSQPVSGSSQAPDRLAINLRSAFFTDCRDIGTRPVQREIAGQLGLPVQLMEELIDTGQAWAALAADYHLREVMRVEGSPTFVLNDGRQKLYGNVGYRVIEANIRELLRRPTAGAASWC
jgi:predicted DsbA family dithiol-disulfide isomerase